MTITIAEDRPDPAGRGRHGHVEKRPRAHAFRRRLQGHAGAARSTDDELREKFLMLTRHCSADEMGEMFDRLQNLEQQADLDWIGVRAQQK